MFYETKRNCPSDYVCLPGLGDNPNFGYTNFDTFPWSMLTTFQLITLDYWENIYNMVSARDEKDERVKCMSHPALRKKLAAAEKFLTRFFRFVSFLLFNFFFLFFF